MSQGLIISLIILYFGVLVAISYFTSRKITSQSFFTADKSSPWYLVAFGMIGASLSGVTFLSVPGMVESNEFSYMQMTLGYLIGYLVIAFVLMPIYYKFKVVSIYQYLDERFGVTSYKTGAFFFLLSRTIGASFRLFLVATTMQYALFGVFGIEMPFAITVAGAIALIWLYTFRGGIKTVVWTDTLQTFFMLVAMVVCVILLIQALDISSFSELKYTRIFFFDDINDDRHFLKQFVSGALIAIVMTGLDQDMMQKNLTCKSLGDAQKNMVSFAMILILVNFAFLTLGSLLFEFQDQMITTDQNLKLGGDKLFASIAMGELGTTAAIMFIVGVIAAAYSSADSALTSLTTSFSVDFLGSTEKKPISKRKRIWVHAGFSVLLFIVILIFDTVTTKGDNSIIIQLFKAAGYTYGPLLGLYTFGIATKMRIRDNWVPLVCILSIVISYVLNMYSQEWFNGFKFGFLIIALNGLLTFLGLLIISTKQVNDEVR